MSSVLLVAHHDRADAVSLSAAAIEWLGARGHTPCMVADDAAALDVADRVTVDDGSFSHALAVSLGGDGTMLRAVNLLGGADTPVIGVNLGLLGYLTEVDPADLLGALERWSSGPEQGSWSIDERMMLEVRIERATAQRAGSAGHEVFTALNEAVIEKRHSGHTIRMKVDVDGTPFTTYAADGLILATPTGSTAYSMSARGPVVSPRLRAMLVTPVSPHMLFDRTLVLDPGERVEVTIIGHRDASLSIDGQPATVVGEGDRVAVMPSSHVARLVRFGNRRFHQVLTAKFGLTDR